MRRGYPHRIRRLLTLALWTVAVAGCRFERLNPTEPDGAVAEVIVSASFDSVGVSEMAPLTAIVRDGAGRVLDDRTVSWSSDDESIATVDNQGVVTGMAVGSTSIVASAQGKLGSKRIGVSPRRVASVSVSPTAAELLVGGSVQLSATPLDSGGNPLSSRHIKWASSSETVARVDGRGLVTARSAGSAEVTARCGGSEGESVISVSVVPPEPVASVEVSPSSGSVRVGETIQLTATPRDSEGNALIDRNVTWSSSNAGVARADSTGLVLGLAEGNATITAMSEGKSGTSTISVIQLGGGAGIIFADDFESGTLDAWKKDGGDVDAGKYSVTSDAAHVRSGNYALEIKLNSATTASYGELFVDLVPQPDPGYEEIYVSMDVMWSRGFQNRRGNNCQMHFVTLGGGRRNNHATMDGKAGVHPDGTDFFLTVAQPDETCSAPYDLLPWAFYTYHMDQQSIWGDLFSQEGSPVYPSEAPTWQRVVVGVKLNSYGPPTLADGWQKMWVDGVKKIDVQGMRWRRDPASPDRLLELNRFMFWAYMGGQPASLGDQYVWVDNVTIQTSRPAGLYP